jgi:3-hydroxyacyl-CoA dehydrogenase
MKQEKIAVIGGGAMGSGIAHAAAAAGFQVYLVDTSNEIVGRALKSIDGRLGKQVEKGKLAAQEKEEILGRVEGTKDLDRVSGVDLAIEAIVEEFQVKADLFRRLNRICSPSTLFATNTSTLSVTQMSVLSGRPEHFIGLHFFNPAHVMRLVEVVPGLLSSQEAINAGVDFAKALKKVPIVVKDCPGFLVNRIMLPYVGEAFLAVQEGAASPAEIDGAARAFGFPMGPLELTDMVGIDISIHTFPVLYEAYGERFPVPLIFEKLFAAGRLGLKTKKGTYVDGKVDEEFRKIVEAVMAETGVKGTGFSIERLVLRQVNEAAYCLQEGVASAEDIDRAMVLGTGFPSVNGVGGPLHWADERGLDKVLEELQELKDTLGQRFWPHHLLKKCVYAGYLGKGAKQGFFTYS